MAVREARWDCQYCGSQGVLGRHKTCPVCTAVRAEGTKFYLPEDSELVTDQKLVDYAKMGPDWVCGSCGNSNGANLRTCAYCQSERSADTAVQETKRYDVGAAPTSGDMTFAEDEARDKQIEEERARQRQARAGANNLTSSLNSDGASSSLLGTFKKMPMMQKLTVGAIGLAGLCLFFFLFQAFSSTNVAASVKGFEWDRAVEIESLQTFTEEDWELPSEARLISQAEEIHHYDQVLVGYETQEREVSEQVQVGTESYVCGQRDLGNGFFEDEYCDRAIFETQYRTESYEEPIYNPVPVYQTKYTFEIDRWELDRTETAEGNNRTAEWPNFNLGEKEREGESRENYAVIFSAENGEFYRMTFDENEWLTFDEGDSVEITVNGFGTAEEVIR